MNCMQSAEANAFLAAQVGEPDKTHPDEISSGLRLRPVPRIKGNLTFTRYFRIAWKAVFERAQLVFSSRAGCRVYGSARPFTCPRMIAFSLFAMRLAKTMLNDQI